MGVVSFPGKGSNFPRPPPTPSAGSAGQRQAACVTLGRSVAVAAQLTSLEAVGQPDSDDYLLLYECSKFARGWSLRGRHVARVGLHECARGGRGTERTLRRKCVVETCYKPPAPAEGDGSEGGMLGRVRKTRAHVLRTFTCAMHVWQGLPCGG